MLEQPIMQRILLACSQGATRLFRFNVGVGWVGSAPKVCRKSEMVMCYPGDVVLRNARPFHAGVEGMSDLMGWHSVFITPAHVGQTMAVFTAVECKTETGRLRPAQRVFIDNVIEAGGIAGVARSAEQAKELISR